MNSRKWFLIIVVTFVISSVLWFTFYKQPLNLELKKTRLHFAEVTNKLRVAQRAKQDLELIRQRRERVQDDLTKIENRIIQQDNLVELTAVLQEKAAQNSLEIYDFTPVLESYFSSEGNEKVKALPVMISLRGRYLNIGRFLDDFSRFDYFLIPREIVLEKLNPGDNDVTATVTTSLYTWNGKAADE
ncbi:MAG: type 4a pilus biogenesis protein PilO [Calditrichia bacterium]